MQSLPKAPTCSLVEFLPGNRSLASVVLPGTLQETARELIAEWRQSERLQRFGIQPRNRVLLHGPSGNGKTTLANAIAYELRLMLGIVRYSDVMGALLGEASGNVAKAFNAAHQCPSILFFDEADSLASSRRAAKGSADQERNGVVNTILLELDRLPASSVVIFATNLPETLDAAMKRRVNLTLELPAPGPEDFRRLFDSLRRRNPLWPLDGFDVDGCGATSFAQLEQMVLDHARRVILSTDDPLGRASQPRSQWLRQQLAGWQEEPDYAEAAQ